MGHVVGVRTVGAMRIVMGTVGAMGRMRRMGGMGIMGRMTVISVGGMGSVGRMGAVGRMGSVGCKNRFCQQHTHDDHHTTDNQKSASCNISFFIKQKIFHRMFHMWEKFIEFHDHVSSILVQVPLLQVVRNVLPEALK